MYFHQCKNYRRSKTESTEIVAWRLFSATSQTMSSDELQTRRPRPCRELSIVVETLG